MEITPVSISPKRITRLLTGISIALIVLSTITAYGDLERGHQSVFFEKMCKLFYVELENNAPAFFSTCILLMASLLLFLIFVSKRHEKDPYRLHWGILSAGFFYMAFDEVSTLHEKLIFPVRGMLGTSNFGVFYFAWVIPAIIIILGLGLFFLKFLKNLQPTARLNFLLAGAIFIGGAVGMEMLDGNFTEIHGKDNVGYIVLTTIEEAMEMAGIIYFNWALLKYLAQNYQRVNLYFNDNITS